MKLNKLLGLATLALAATAAQAFPTLKVSANGSSMTDDNGAITTVGTASTTSAFADGLGGVDWTGTVDGWTLSSESGVSGLDAVGTGDLLDLSFSDKAGKLSAVGVTGMLTVSWSDAFGPFAGGPISASIGGTLPTGMIATFSIWEGATLVPGTLQTFVGSAGTNKKFGGDAIGIVSPSGLTSISEVLTLTAAKQNQLSSGDAGVTPPPPVPDSGMTMVLVGLGIGALGLVARFRTSRKSGTIA